MQVTAKVSIPHSKKLKNRLTRIRLLVDGGWQKDVLKLLDETETFLIDNTPRSDLVGSQSGNHLADGWTLHTIGGKAKDRESFLAVIYNKFIMTKSGTILESAWLKVKGVKQNYTLLHILEYGSKWHYIGPWKKKALHFFSREGKEVITKKVRHPGTKAYGMVRKAKARFFLRMNVLTALWIMRIRSYKG